MKSTKLTTLLMIALICIGCIFGCGRAENSVTTSSEPSSAEKSDLPISSATSKELDGTGASSVPTTTEMPDPPETTPSPEVTDPPAIDQPTIERPLLTLVSYDEYLKFINSSALPDHFVAYEAVSQFGTFDSFVCTSEASEGDYSEYTYFVVDESDVELALSIDLSPENETDSTANILTHVNAEDMRKLSGEESGAYTQSGIRYSYASGMLLSVSWQIDGIEYSIHTTDYSLLADYPLDSSAQVAKLLNLQSADEVLSALSTEVDQ